MVVNFAWDVLTLPYDEKMDVKSSLQAISLLTSDCSEISQAKQPSHSLKKTLTHFNYAPEVHSTSLDMAHRNTMSSNDESV